MAAQATRSPTAAFDYGRSPLAIPRRTTASPRRQQLLRDAGIEIEVHPAHINEDQKPGEAPIDYALRLAREKAQAIAARFLNRFVLGADTIVVIQGEVLGKPNDAADAARMLRRLSGCEHAVTTAVSLVLPDPGTQTQSLLKTKTMTTKVFFRSLSEDEIQSYVATGEPMDKAGAYAIQGGAAQFADRIEGDYSNVVGLPIPLVLELLRESGLG